MKNTIILWLVLVIATLAWAGRTRVKDQMRFDDANIDTGTITTLTSTTATIGTATITTTNGGALSADTAEIGGSTHYLEVESDGTLEFKGNATVWEDVKVTLGSISRPGASDPAWVAYDINGSGTSTYLLEFAKNDIGTFVVQLPHSYKEGTNITVHVHWTPGPRGNEESGATVGWKTECSWTNINGTFPNPTTSDLSDACDGTDHKHQMSPTDALTGTSKTISSMLMCNITRTDTGTDDTWAGAVSGQLPLLMEIDFHFEIDTVGSRTVGAK